MPTAEVVAARRTPQGMQPIENSEETADETTLSQLPRWFGAVALAAGATLLFLLILLTPSDGGSKPTPAAQPAAQSAPIVVQPQASPVPRATLEPLDPPVAVGLEPPPAPKPLEQPVPPSPPPTQIAAGPLPSTGNANGSPSPTRMPALPVGPTPRTYLPNEPAARGIHSNGSSTVQTQAGPVRGHVDNGTSTTPMRPIETRDPYKSP